MRRTLVAKFNVPKSGKYEIRGPVESATSVVIQREPAMSLLPSKAYQGSLIRYLRVNAGYSVEDFAEKVKIDKSKISRVENYQTQLNGEELTRVFRVLKI